MKKSMKNTVHVEGYLYQHSLEQRTTGENSKNPNTPYIRGNIEIATDEALTNIISINFVYVTQNTSKGTANPTYAMLANIISGNVFSVMANGKELAAKLRVDGNIGVNEFEARDGSYVIQQLNSGSFVRNTPTLVPDEAKRMRWECDTILTKTTLKEADEEKNIAERLEISGYTFDFRGALIPFKAMVHNPAAIAYFEGMEITEQHPLCTEVRGTQIHRTVIRKVESPNAWGTMEVREVPSTVREYVLDWASLEPYEYDETFISEAEFKAKIAGREVVIATNKARAQQAASSAPAAPSAFSAAPTSPAKAATPASVYDF